MIKAVVWNEFAHERSNEAVKAVYPDGIHATIAGFLNADPGIEAGTATLDEAEHGLPASRLAETDVLLWWGHMKHRDVDDAVVARVRERVLEGMGFIVLHSGHLSKPFTSLMGTSGALKWREVGEREHIWTVNPGHEIARGVGPRITIEEEEMYGEPFGIPEPDESVFISWFEGGEVFRSGVCWRRGAGRIFYFRPGHETYPTYHDERIQRVILNSVHWAAPKGDHFSQALTGPSEPIEEIGRLGAVS